MLGLLAVVLPPDDLSASVKSGILHRRRGPHGMALPRHPALLPLFVDLPGWLESLLVFALAAITSYRKRLCSG